MLALLQKEIEVFKKLNEPSRALIVATFLWSIVAPLFSTFSNAYLWRTSHDLMSLTLFNLTWFVSVYFSYRTVRYLSAWLNLGALLALGLIVFGLSGICILVVPEVNILNTSLLGSALGYFAGFYWAPQLILMQVVSESRQRSYFFNLYLLVVTACAIIMPVIIGFSLEQGKILLGLSEQISYWVVFILSVSILIYAASYVIKANFKKIGTLKLKTKKSSKIWNKIKSIYFFVGISNGVGIMFPTVVILYFYSSEGKLGLATAGAALAGVAFSYIIARIGNQGAEKLGLTVGCWALILGSLALAFGFSKLTAMIFVLLQGASVPLVWGYVGPLCMQVIAQEAKHEPNLEYGYYVEREQWLAFGRLLGYLVFVVSLLILGQEYALRYVFLVLALWIIPAYFIAKPLSNRTIDLDHA